MEYDDANKYIFDIVESIKVHNPLEVILFGSFSKEQATSESDIDILIVLDLDIIPECYEEKMKLKSSIRRSIREINRKIAIDLLVYTKKEMEIMKKENNAFLNEINKTGKVLYEKAS